MSTLAARIAIVSLVLVAAACTEPPGAGVEPSTAASLPGRNGVRTFSAVVQKDERDRIGTTDAPQSFTPRAQLKPLTSTLRTRWVAHVGTSSPRTTMAATGGKIIIGTHGAVAGVHVLDAKTGESRAYVRVPDGTGVEGIAVEGDAIFFTTSQHRVARASLAGSVAWNVDLGARAPAAPALADINRDGVVDAVVGTGAGEVVALDGRSGRPLWRSFVGADATKNVGVEGGVAIGDVDGDGYDEIVAGAGDGSLVALRLDGQRAWTRLAPSFMSAPPQLVDADADGRLEVLASWVDGHVGIFDGATGRPLWETWAERDDGRGEGLFAAPALVPGPHVGAVIVPTYRWGDTDGLVVLAETERRFRSLEGSVTASPVVMTLTAGGTPDAIVGTLAGDLVAIDATGGRTFLANVGASVRAAALVTDIDQDGVREILVAADDGQLRCWSTGVASVPLVARFRGAESNRGVMPPTNLGWTFARGRDRAIERRSSL